MTIFLMVLKKLIKEQLSPLSTNLASQAKSYGYKKDLSLDQKDIIDKLEESILLFKGSKADDEGDVKKIHELIVAAHKKIQAARELHQEPKDSGSTIDCITKLMLRPAEFCDKLAEFKKIQFLNMEYSETPHNIIYFHAAYYLGDNVFNPLEGIDVQIRTKKEEKLQLRLEALSAIIKPTDTLAEQKLRCKQMVDDLASDNKLVIKKDDGAKNISLPGFSFWGVQMTVPKEWFGAGEGRMAQQFSLAYRNIMNLTEETFEPPIIPEVHEAAVNEM